MESFKHILQLSLIPNLKIKFLIFWDITTSVVRRYWNFGENKYWTTGLMKLEYWNTGILKKYLTPVFPHYILCMVHQTTRYNKEQDIIWNLENKIGYFFIISVFQHFVISSFPEFPSCIATLITTHIVI